MGRKKKQQNHKRRQKKKKNGPVKAEEGMGQSCIPKKHTETQNAVSLVPKQDEAVTTEVAIHLDSDGPGQVVTGELPESDKEPLSHQPVDTHEVDERQSTGKLEPQEKYVTTVKQTAEIMKEENNSYLPLQSHGKEHVDTKKEPVQVQPSEAHVEDQNKCTDKKVPQGKHTATLTETAEIMKEENNSYLPLQPHVEKHADTKKEALQVQPSEAHVEDQNKCTDKKVPQGKDTATLSKTAEIMKEENNSYLPVQPHVEKHVDTKKEALQVQPSEAHVEDQNKCTDKKVPQGKDTATLSKDCSKHEKEAQNVAMSVPGSESKQQKKIPRDESTASPSAVPAKRPSFNIYFHAVFDKKFRFDFNHDKVIIVFDENMVLPVMIQHFKGLGKNGYLLEVTVCVDPDEVKRKIYYHYELQKPKFSIREMAYRCLQVPHNVSGNGK
ncbi:uncharacterized protein LOC122812981 [Protopterus annectens]|uniref:uncharacterized protein LOC122812981 n=1 Tax=Protopterus annectens TaxID=7888 RepID=UPI001CFAB3E4|nr:uncharacterized protein LOC122812981 [Protopterus annectens]XP_043941009.1 uncharacterized protein LOC122812981 [Protopterus annectens]